MGSQSDSQVLTVSCWTEPLNRAPFLVILFSISVTCVSTGLGNSAVLDACHFEMARVTNKPTETHITLFSTSNKLTSTGGIKIPYSVWHVLLGANVDTIKRNITTQHTTPVIHGSQLQSQQCYWGMPPLEFRHLNNGEFVTEVKWTISTYQFLWEISNVTLINPVIHICFQVFWFVGFIPV